MNAKSLARFSKASGQASQALRGSVVQIGDETYPAAVFHSDDTVENERGGNALIRTMVVQIDRCRLAEAPAVGTRITDTKTGITGELFQVAGRGLAYHILRCASHPSKSA